MPPAREAILSAFLMTAVFTFAFIFTPIVVADDDEGNRDDGTDAQSFTEDTALLPTHCCAPLEVWWLECQASAARILAYTMQALFAATDALHLS